MSAKVGATTADVLLEEDDPVIRAFDNAPLAGPDDISPEELAHLEAAMAAPIGPGASHADVLKQIEARAKRDVG